jgi:uncharacterized SAM-binding protein YcdF (DUF218 family)
MKYDLIIVLATQPDTTTWKFPKQIYDCLDKASELFNQQQARLIATSGKWSTALDNKGIMQPFRECDAMADYLIAKGVPDNKILREGDSQDTISNLYYLKKNFLMPNDMKNLLFVVAEWRIPRLTFLCQRILATDYNVSFSPIPSTKPAEHDEALAFEKQKKFLEPMKDGDHSWLDGKFFNAWLYQYWAKRDKQQR